MKIIPISGEIGWDVWPQQIRDQLPTDGSDVEFHISSPGGYVYDGLEIFNIIKNYAGKTTAKIIGMAASMASYIPLAADRVIAESNAIYMIHNASAYTGGDQNAHEKVAKILRGMSNLLGQEYVSQTGKTSKAIAKLMDAETYYFGNEMLEAGFVDEIIEVKTEPDQEEKDDLILDVMAKVEILDKKLQEKPEKFENIDKIAALLPTGDGKSPNLSTKPAKIPVNKTQTHEENMNLKEILAKYPDLAKEIDDLVKAGVDEKTKEVKATHETALTDMKTTHETALAEARTEIENGKLSTEHVKKVGAVISSTEYGNSIKGAGIKVLTGEKDYSSFEDLVALSDEHTAQLKAAGIIKDQPEGTPPVDDPAGEEQKKAQISASAKAGAAKFKREV